MEGKKIFVPQELKTVEIDVEKKVFRVNGENFGKDCTGFSISCQTGDRNNWFDITIRIDTDLKFANYNFDGELTSSGERHPKKSDAAGD